MSIALNIGSSSAIPDYSTLKQTVSDWLDRDDLDAKIPQFVQLAESHFNRILRAGSMETSTVITATAEDVALPSDWLGMRAIYVEGSPDSPLSAIPPSALRQYSDGTPGTPTAYSLVAGILRLIPPPDDTVYLKLDYFAKLVQLTDESPTNWLLQNHPDAYLYGTLWRAEAYLKNAQGAAEFKSLADEVVNEVNRAAENNRYGAGPLSRNTVAQVGRSRC